MTTFFPTRGQKINYAVNNGGGISEQEDYKSHLQKSCNPPILRSKDVHRTRLPSSYMATWLAQNKAEISQNGSKLNNVSKVTKLHYFLLPPPNKSQRRRTTQLY